jgi:hypothetical protein
MPRKSKVAAEARAAQLDAIRRMTPDERVRLAEEISERDLQFYMAFQNVDRIEALRAIRRERQAGRQHSRANEEP